MPVSQLFVKSKPAVDFLISLANFFFVGSRMRNLGSGFGRVRIQCCDLVWRPGITAVCFRGSLNDESVVKH